jgi:HPt (histidine-containing phosphotransfer) domain-containing protein
MTIATSRPPARNQGPVAFDRITSAMDDLKQLGGVDFAQSLVETFAGTSTASVAKIRSGDPAEKVKAAHSIAGAAGQMGAVRLEALARDIERLLRRGGTLEPAQAARLEAEVALAIALLRVASRR